MKHNQSGLTLVELIVTIAIVALLAGALVNIIDAKKQEQKAQDAVQYSNIKLLADAIETYYVAERSYPDEGTQNNPLHASASTSGVAAVYISTWPGDVYKYHHDGSNFSVFINKFSDGAFIIKYSSSWKEVRECSSSTPANDVSACN